MGISHSDSDIASIEKKIEMDNKTILIQDYTKLTWKKKRKTNNNLEQYEEYFDGKTSTINLQHNKNHVENNNKSRALCTKKSHLIIVDSSKNFNSLTIH